MGDNARIGRNLGAVALAHIAAQALAFVVSIAVTRTLGVDPYGVFVFGFAFPSWFVLLVSLGLDYVVTVDVAADRGKGSTYLTAVTVLRVPLVLVAIVALWASLEVLLPDPAARSVVLVLGVANLLSAFNGTFDAVFRAHERFEFSALVMVTERAIATTSVLLLLALGHGLAAVAGAYLLSVGVSTGLSIGLVRRRFARFLPRVERGLLLRLVRRAAPFATAALVSALMFSTAPVLLTFLRGPGATGHFNAAFVLLVALMAPLQMYNLVFLPRMSRLHRHSPGQLPALLQRTQRLFFAVALPIALGGALYSETLVVGLYGEAFRESAPVFAVLGGVLAVATASLGAGTALGATDRAALELRYSGSGAGVNVLLCVLLIPPLGPLGAAWAFLVASAVIAVLRLRATTRIITPYQARDVLARPTAAGGVMALALFLTSFPPLLPAIALGATVYFASLAGLRGITREDVSLLAEIARGVFSAPGDERVGAPPNGRS